MPSKLLTDPFIRNYPTPSKRVEIFDSQVTGLAVRITMKGVKTFVLRYYTPENRNMNRFTIGKFPAISLAEARKLAKDFLLGVQSGNDPMNDKRTKQAEAAKQAARITFDTLCTQFLHDHVSKLRFNTRNDYSSRINKHIRPALKSKLIENFTRQDARRLLAVYADNNQPVQANRIHAILSKMLNFAVEEGYIRANPMLGLPKLGREKSRERAYDNAEIASLWDAFEKQDTIHGTYLKVLLMTAQRRGEVVKMKWEHIDFGTGVWNIPAENTKNKVEHYIPLQPLALDMIESLKPLTGEQAFVFNSMRVDNTPIAGFTKLIMRIKKMTSIKDFRLHDLRRTVATNLAKDGVPIHVLKKILNHTEGKKQDITSVYNRYDYMDEKRTALINWSRNLMGIVNGSTGEAKIYSIG